MEIVTVKAKKFDGSIYRMCDAEVLLSTPCGCVVHTNFGAEVTDGTKLIFKQDAHIRTFFAYGARLNLLEVYEPDYQLREIYMNITAPQKELGADLEYVDLELDVTRVSANSDKAEIVDQDEFEEATTQYNYSDELIAACYEAAELGVQIADAWEHGKSMNLALEHFCNIVCERGT